MVETEEVTQSQSPEREVREIEEEAEDMLHKTLDEIEWEDQYHMKRNLQPVGKINFGRTSNVLLNKADIGE